VLTVFTYIINTLINLADNYVNLAMHSTARLSVQLTHDLFTIAKFFV